MASQLLRLAQSDPIAWLACDYAGRLGMLALLLLHPEARKVAFATGARRRSWLETILQIVLLLIVHRLIWVHVLPAVEGLLPGTKLGKYPQPAGLIYLFDIALGLLLVAISEEILFRRCARQVLAARFGDGWAMIACSAALFAAYHWWTGVPNIASTFLSGIVQMLVFRRLQVLWPSVVAHYLFDVIMFS